MFLETRNTLSGGGAVRIEVHPEDDEVTATYAHSFDGIGARTKNVKKELYYQFSIYVPNVHPRSPVQDGERSRATSGINGPSCRNPISSFGQGRGRRHECAFLARCQRLHGRPEGYAWLRSEVVVEVR
jgi:hypothetical protein